MSQIKVGEACFKNLLILVKLGSGVDDELAKIVHNDRFQMCKFPFYIIGPHPILTQVIFELFESSEVVHGAIEGAW